MIRRLGYNLRCFCPAGAQRNIRAVYASQPRHRTANRRHARLSLPIVQAISVSLVRVASALLRRSNRAMNDESSLGQFEPARQDAHAAERLAGLERIAIALSGATTVETVAEGIISEGVAAPGGASGSIALIDDNGLELVTIRCHGYPRELIERYARYETDTPMPNA